MYAEFNQCSFLASAPWITPIASVQWKDWKLRVVVRRSAVPNSVVEFPHHLLFFIMRTYSSISHLKRCYIVFFRLRYRAWECKKFVFASPSESQLILECSLIIVHCKDTRARAWCLRDRRSQASSADSTRPSCAMSSR